MDKSGELKKALTIPGVDLVESITCIHSGKFLETALYLGIPVRKINE